MGENTKIEWADHTASFWEGCAKVAPGCKFCYAEAFERRMGRDIWGKHKPRKWTKTGPALIRKLNRKAKAAGRIDTVFVNALADFFEDHDGDVRDSENRQVFYCDECGEFTVQFGVTTGGVECFNECGVADRLTLSILRQHAFRLFDECQNLIFMLLTKRPENIFPIWNAIDDRQAGVLQKHRPNVWLGMSIANQADWDASRDYLLECRNLAARLFVSYEPAIGPVDFGDPSKWAACDVRRGIDWVIIGGESGHNARPFHIDWARSAIAQCRDAGVACFFKQCGSRPIATHYEYWSSRGSKGGDPDEWPEGLDVREFPAGAQ